MDLLGSIMGSMTAPPGMSDKEKEKRKKQKEMEKKMEEKQRAETNKMRKDAENKIGAFVKDDKLHRMELPPMPKFQVG